MALKVVLVLALLASVYLHRSPSLASQPVLSRVDAVVAELQRLIPQEACVRIVWGYFPGRVECQSPRVFLLGDPLYLTLAGHRTYWQQVSNPGEGLTFLEGGYERTGMWGPREIATWLNQSHYVVLQAGVLQAYYRRPAYQALLMALVRTIEQRYDTIGRVSLPSGDTQVIWRQSSAPRTSRP